MLNRLFQDRLLLYFRTCSKNSVSSRLLKIIISFIQILILIIASLPHKPRVCLLNSWYLSIIFHNVTRVRFNQVLFSSRSRVIQLVCSEISLSNMLSLHWIQPLYVLLWWRHFLFESTWSYIAWSRHLSSQMVIKPSKCPYTCWSFKLSCLLVSSKISHIPKHFFIWF